jgi:enamine deaminase RidA (YjgF/YER057c/UK114 family)
LDIRPVLPGNRYPAALVHNGTIYFSGCIARDFGGGLYEQTKDILAQLEAILAAAGSDKKRILSTTVFLRDIEQYEEHHRAWTEWWDSESKPTRTGVEAKLFHPDCRVEIQVIAAVSPPEQ